MKWIFQGKPDILVNSSSSSSASFFLERVVRFVFLFSRCFSFHFWLISAGRLALLSKCPLECADETTIAFVHDFQMCEQQPEPEYATISGWQRTTRTHTHGRTLRMQMANYDTNEAALKVCMLETWDEKYDQILAFIFIAAAAAYSFSNFASTRVGSTHSRTKTTVAVVCF